MLIIHIQTTFAAGIICVTSFSKSNTNSTELFNISTHWLWLLRKFIYRDFLCFPVDLIESVIGVVIHLDLFKKNNDIIHIMA